MSFNFNLGLVICIGVICSFGLVNSTPLDDYVNLPDPTYGYQLIKTYKLDNSRLFILNLTSQKWYDSKLMTIV